MRKSYGKKTDALIAFARKYRDIGVRFSDLQRFICEYNGLDYNEMRDTQVYNYRTNSLSIRTRRRYRGYWCDRFYSTYRQPGILDKLFVKRNSLWFLKDGV